MDCEFRDSFKRGPDYLVRDLNNYNIIGHHCITYIAIAIDNCSLLTVWYYPSNSDS